MLAVKRRRKRKKKRKTKKTDLFVVASSIKSYIKNKKMMSSGDLVSTLNDEMKRIVDRAVIRCKANKRNTVQSKDI